MFMNIMSLVGTKLKQNIAFTSVLKYLVLLN